MESFLRRFPETGANHRRHNKGVPIDVFDQFLKEEEAAAEEPNNGSGYVIVGAGPLYPIIQIFYTQTRELSYGKDEGSTSHCAKVKSQGPFEGFSKDIVGAYCRYLLLIFC